MEPLAPSGECDWHMLVVVMVVSLLHLSPERGFVGSWPLLSPAEVLIELRVDDPLQLPSGAFN